MNRRTVFLLAMLIGSFLFSLLHTLSGNNQPVVMTAALFLFGVVSAFLLGKEWRSSRKPISVFKGFLSRKIEEAAKLLNSRLVDETDKRTADGKIDYTVLEPFRLRYAEWRKQVGGGFSHAFRGGNNVQEIETFTKLSEVKVEVEHGKFRVSLRHDIRDLERIQREVKTDWFAPDFKAENLREYEAGRAAGFFKSCVKWLALFASLAFLVWIGYFMALEKNRLDLKGEILAIFRKTS